MSWITFGDWPFFCPLSVQLTSTVLTSTNSLQISSTLAVLIFMNNSRKDCLPSALSGGARDDALRTSTWRAKPIRNGDIFDWLITEYVTYLLLFFCQKIPQLREQVYPHLMCKVGVSVAQLSHWTQKRESLKSHQNTFSAFTLRLLKIKNDFPVQNITPARE